MATETAPRLSPRLLYPRTYCANGMDVIAPAGAKLAEATNMLASRGKVLLTKAIPMHTVTGSAAVTAFYGGFRTSRAAYDASSDLMVKVRAVFVCLPSDIGASSASRPEFRASVHEYNDAGTAVATTVMPYLYPNDRLAVPAAGYGPDHVAVVDQEWDLKADTPYAIEIGCLQKANVAAVTIYEVPVRKLYKDPSDPTADNCVSHEHFAARAPILDTAVTDLQATMFDVWKKHGPELARWGYGFTEPSLTTTSTSYVNAWDSAYTDWNADAPGFHHLPYNRGSYSSNNVPIAIWVYAANDASNGTISFRTTSGSDLATVTVNQTSSTWFVTSANLDASQTRSKIDVLFKGTGGSQTRIRAISIREWSA